MQGLREFLFSSRGTGMEQLIMQRFGMQKNRRDEVNNSCTPNEHVNKHKNVHKLYSYRRRDARFQVMLSLARLI